jgi:hypothetical protein
MERRNFLKRVIGGAGTLGFWGSYGGAASLVVSPPENTLGFDDTAGISRTPYAREDHGAFAILQGVTDAERTQLSIPAQIDLSFLPPHRRLELRDASPCPTEPRHARSL